MGLNDIIETNSDDIRIFSKSAVFYNNLPLSEKRWKLDEFSLPKSALDKVAILDQHSTEDLVKARTKIVFDRYEETESTMEKARIDAVLGKFDSQVTNVFIYTNPDLMLRRFVPDPFSWVTAHKILDAPVPGSIIEEATEVSREKLIGLYQAFLGFKNAERAYSQKVEKLRDAAKHGGILRESGAVTVVEDEDDIAIMTMWDNRDLKEHREKLRGFVKERKKFNLDEFVKTVQIQPGVNIDVKEFLDGLDEILK